MEKTRREGDGVMYMSKDKDRDIKKCILDWKCHTAWQLKLSRTRGFFLCFFLRWQLKLSRIRGFFLCFFLRWQLKLSRSRGFFLCFFLRWQLKLSRIRGFFLCFFLRWQLKLSRIRGFFLCFFLRWQLKLSRIRGFFLCFFLRWQLKLSSIRGFFLCFFLRWQLKLSRIQGFFLCFFLRWQLKLSRIRGFFLCFFLRWQLKLSRIRGFFSLFSCALPILGGLFGAPISNAYYKRRTCSLQFSFLKVFAYWLCCNKQTTTFVFLTPSFFSQQSFHYMVVPFHYGHFKSVGRWGAMARRVFYLEISFGPEWKYRNLWQIYPHTKILKLDKILF